MSITLRYRLTASAGYDPVLSHLPREDALDIVGAFHQVLVLLLVQGEHGGLHAIFQTCAITLADELNDAGYVRYKHRVFRLVVTGNILLQRTGHEIVLSGGVVEQLLNPVSELLFELF